MELLDLIKCECIKLKRKKFIPLTIFAALLFPVPMTIFAQKSNLSFDWLYLNIAVFGYFLLLPIVLGIIGAMLFFSEKDNETLKNIKVIPISNKDIIFSKIIVLLLISYIYSITSNGATLLGGFLIGEVGKIPYRIFMGIVISTMITIAILPVIAVEALCKKGYVFAIILSVLYSSASFAIVFAMSNLLLPLSAVCRWALPHISTGPTYGLDDWFLTLPICLILLVLTACISLSITIIIKNKEEI